jgi:hypothetical protein
MKLFIPIRLGSFQCSFIPMLRWMLLEKLMPVYLLYLAFNPDYGGHFQYSFNLLKIFIITNTSEWRVKTVQYGGSSSKLLGCLATHVGQCCQQETA